MGLIPVLVEGMMQQQQEIENLKQENAALKQLQEKYQILEERLSTLENQ